MHETSDDLCPRVGAGTDQSIALAKAISRPRPDIYYMPNQYEKEANFLANYESTGPEIWRQTQGKITHFVAGCGTGGTITGTATYLNEKNKDVRVVAVQAQRNHLLQGLRNFEESAMPELFKRRVKVVNKWTTATNKESFDAVIMLSRKENLLVGPSSGSVMSSMVKAVEALESGVLVGIFADDGGKFKSLYVQQGIFSEEKYVEAFGRAKFLSEMTGASQQK